MIRVACALVVVSQLLLLPLLVEPTGRRAILASFVGAPLLAVGLFLGFVWWFRSQREE